MSALFEKAREGIAASADQVVHAVDAAADSTMSLVDWLEDGWTRIDFSTARFRINLRQTTDNAGRQVSQFMRNWRARAREASHALSGLFLSLRETFEKSGFEAIFDDFRAAS